MIFFTGVHGVGKTTLCKKVATQFDLIYANAGEIIRSEKQNGIELTEKRVVDIDENQELLVRGLRRLKTDSTLLLDGHLTLLNQEFEINRVPMNFLKSINPQLIVLMTNSLAEIVKNLKNRDSRDYSEELIQRQQFEEENYARQIAENLNIPFKVFNSYKELQVADFLRSFLKERDRHT